MSARIARHCPQCGSALGRAVVEGRERSRCPDCSFVLYENPACAVAALVVDGRGRVLLVRRALDPCKGEWALPAGFQEIDEQPAETAVREVREEAGLEIRPQSVFDLFLVAQPGRRAVTLAVYLCQPKGGEPTPGDDALEARFFDLDALPDAIGFDNRERILSHLRADPRYLACITMSTQSTGGTRSISYKDSGVDIEKKYGAVERATDAIRKTFTPGVVGDIGNFGGLFDLARAGVGQGMLVASADGVGTKLEVAKRAKVYHTVGRDLVNHCINDILVQGARPLFFMDYVAVGKMEPEVVAELIRGCAEGCRENAVALLGGETAEMPGLYAPGDFDLAGFIVGIVDPAKLLDGSRVRPGQVVLGLGSAGLHTNGYSLARKILFDHKGHSVEDRPAALGGASVGEALLAEHRSYLKLLWPLLEQGKIAAMAHITGGGLVDNLPRVLGSSDAVLDRSAWPVPALFRYLCEAGNVDAEERYQVLNMGIGMTLIVDAADVAAVGNHFRAVGEPFFTLGRIEAGSGVVRWSR
ncbi:MAG: phosphoribosylformylglycinamidine cyclo-ligase [Planctomycetota bacterium]